MKFAIAVHGTRGDVEPAAAVALELQRRGHQVRMAVPPNLVDFAESAGLADVQSYQDPTPRSSWRRRSFGIGGSCAIR